MPWLLLAQDAPWYLWGPWLLLALWVVGLAAGGAYALMAGPARRVGIAIIAGTCLGAFGFVVVIGILLVKAGWD